MKLRSLLPTYHPVEHNDSFSYRFTVFTPVYNRADTIYRVFESLEKQTFKDFELLIINDGSNDNSHEVIQEFMKSSTLQINYINNSENRHKMACLVQGIKEAKGEFFLPFDSDDECTANALETFKNYFDQIGRDSKQKYSGVTCLCKDQDGNLVGKPFPVSPHISSSFENRIKGVDQMEKWGFNKTSILKGVTINPAVYSKGYIPEGIIWNLLSKEGFKTIFVNDVLRVYYLDTGNRISNQNHKKDAFGMMVFSLAILNWFHKEYFWENPKVFLKRIYTLLRSSIFLEFKLGDYLKALDGTWFKLIFTLLWPFKKLLLKIIK